MAHCGLNTALKPAGASQACHGIRVHSVQTAPAGGRQGPASPLLCYRKPGRDACGCANVQACVHRGIKSSLGGIKIIEFMSPATLRCKYFIYLTHLILTGALFGKGCHSSRFATSRSNAHSHSESSPVCPPTATGPHPKLSTPSSPSYTFFTSQPFSLSSEHYRHFHVSVPLC